MFSKLLLWVCAGVCVSARLAGERQIRLPRVPKMTGAFVIIPPGIGEVCVFNIYGIGEDESNFSGTATFCAIVSSLSKDGLNCRPVKSVTP